MIKIIGSYILIIYISKNSIIKIASLGKIKFDKGYYTYIGSAMNNLDKRIQRHLRKEKRLHWHIDYLLANKNVKIIKVYYIISKNREECKIAYLVSKHGESIKGFGCSDCKCESHLYKLKNLRWINGEKGKNSWMLFRV